MSRRTKIILALGVALAATVGGVGVVYAQQAERPACAPAARPASRPTAIWAWSATAGGDLRAQVEAINIQRRARLHRTRPEARREDRGSGGLDRLRDLQDPVQPGQYYRLPDGVWRKRDNTPMPLPAYCG